ncbi:hypothetical protein AKJ16_DCAP25650 [Drosera capensis]
MRSIGSVDEEVFSETESERWILGSRDRFITRLVRGSDSTCIGPLEVEAQGKQSKVGAYV